MIKYDYNKNKFYIKENISSACWVYWVSSLNVLSPKVIVLNYYSNLLKPYLANASIIQKLIHWFCTYVMFEKAYEGVQFLLKLRIELFQNCFYASCQRNQWALFYMITLVRNGLILNWNLETKNVPMRSFFWSVFSPSMGR